MAEQKQTDSTAKEKKIKAKVKKPVNKSAEKQSSPQELNSNKLFCNTTITTVVGRFTAYMLLLGILLTVDYPDYIRFMASVSIIFIALASNFYLFLAQNLKPLVKNYLRGALAIFDTGIITLLIFIQGSSLNAIILMYPILTWTYSFNGINLALLCVFLFNMVFYYISGIMFNPVGIFTFNIYIGIAVHLGLVLWIFSFSGLFKLANKKYSLGYRFIEYMEKVLDFLPDSISSKLQLFCQTKNFRILEDEFRKKASELISIIQTKEAEICLYKEHLETLNSTDEPDEDIEMAFSEINSLLEMENLTLKEANKKLTETNKDLEERINTLSEELEIANVELERIYSSMQDSTKDS
ncbi:MAG: hypothetical protein AB1454_09640 [Candidatus Auribacterota bacterium]